MGGEGEGEGEGRDGPNFSFNKIVGYSLNE